MEVAFSTTDHKHGCTTSRGRTVRCLYGHGQHARFRCEPLRLACSRRSRGSSCIRDQNDSMALSESPTLPIDGSRQGSLARWVKTQEPPTAVIHIAIIDLMVRRLTGENTPSWHGTLNPETDRTKHPFGGVAFVFKEDFGTDEDGNNTLELRISRAPFRVAILALHIGEFGHHSA